MARQDDRIRIGTRGSPLALYQAEATRHAVLAAHPALARDAVEIVPIRTRGDEEQSRPLADIGGKGLFTAEIERALADEAIDLAVHSLKDMPTALPDGLAIGCVLVRADPRDAFLSAVAASLDALPQGARVGTSSIRRAAQLRRLRPDLRILPFRGNVGTRLAKLDRGEVEATILAAAGLDRLGLADRITERIAPEVMLPAVCQGIIAIEMRARDARIADLLDPVGDGPTATAAAAERALLAALDGSCRTPIAAYAEAGPGDAVRLTARIIKPDGSKMHEVVRDGRRADAEALGRGAGEALKAAAGPAFLADAG